MIIKIEGVTHGRLADLVLALESEDNQFRGLAVSFLKEAKDNGQGFNVVLEINERVVVGQRPIGNGNHHHDVLGLLPLKFLTRLFASVDLFPETDEPATR